jgi:hypothetical protein
MSVQVIISGWALLTLQRTERVGKADTNVFCCLLALRLCGGMYLGKCVA